MRLAIANLLRRMANRIYPVEPSKLVCTVKLDPSLLLDEVERIMKRFEDEGDEWKRDR